MSYQLCQAEPKESLAMVGILLHKSPHCLEKNGRTFTCLRGLDSSDLAPNNMAEMGTPNKCLRNRYIDDLGAARLISIINQVACAALPCRHRREDVHLDAALGICFGVKYRGRGAMIRVQPTRVDNLFYNGENGYQLDN